MKRKTTLTLLALLFIASIAAAQRLPRTISPVHYDLTFTPDLAKETFAGDETITVSVEVPTTTVRLHAMQISFGEVTISSEGVDASSPCPPAERPCHTTQKATVTPDQANEMVTLTVPSPIANGPAKIHIAYGGILNKDLKGLYIGEAGGRKYASTQLEAAAARYMFPSFDEPEMKATFRIVAVIDEGDMAISNGAQTSDEPRGAKHLVRFATTPRMSPYLVALTVGPFECLKDEVDGIPLRVCATHDRVADGRFALETAKAALSFYNRYYGVRYPFGKLDQVGVPDFAAGAMENTGDIIYRETTLLVRDSDPVSRKKGVAAVISHEIAHQWFGDLVTMKWWNDVWLNEGFATFMTSKPLKVWKPEWEFDAGEVNDPFGALPVDALQSTRPIRADATTSAQVENMFDAIAYGKTAWVLQMVQSYIGEEAFRAGVNDYVASNAYANTSAEDFTRAMDRASSKPAGEVLTSFVKQPGLPLITATSVCDAGTTMVTLKQERFFADPLLNTPAGAPPPAPAWVIPICFRDQCELLREKQRTFRVSGCDPLDLNRNAFGYYVTQYEPAEVLRVASSPSLEPLEKFALIRDEWTLTRAGRRDFGDFLRLADALRNDRDPRVLEQLASAFDFIATRLSTPENEAALRSWVSAYVRPVVTGLGWSPKAGESQGTSDLRARLLLTLAETGHDRATIDKANELAKLWLTDAHAIDPSLIATVLLLAAVRSDPALYDGLLQKYASSSDPQERALLLRTIARFIDPKLAIRTLEWSLTPSVRSQDAASLMGGVLGTPDVQRVAWSYFIGNWDRFRQKIPQVTTGSRGGPIAALSTLCDPSLREAAAAALNAHPTPGTERAVAQNLELSAQCVATRALQAPKVAVWAKSLPDRVHAGDAGHPPG